jgi:hypothetical protein
MKVLIGLRPESFSAMLVKMLENILLIINFYSFTLVINFYFTSFSLYLYFLF